MAAKREAAGQEGAAGRGTASAAPEAAAATPRRSGRCPEGRACTLRTMMARVSMCGSLPGLTDDSSGSIFRWLTRANLMHTPARRVPRPSGRTFAGRRCGRVEASLLLQAPTRQTEGARISSVGQGKHLSVSTRVFLVASARQAKK